MTEITNNGQFSFDSNTENILNEVKHQNITFYEDNEDQSTITTELTEENTAENTDSDTETDADADEVDNIKVQKLLETPYEGILEFLKDCPPVTSTKDNNKNSFTHTSIGFPQGSYYVPREAMDRVYQLLDKSLRKGQKIHLTEAPLEESPLKVDLDFRFDYEESKRKYTIEHIQGMVKIYNKVISEYINVPEDQINAYVFERPFPYKFKGNTKDGIHIIYPDIVVHTDVQHLIRDKVLEMCPEVLHNLCLKNSYDDVVDLAIISRNNWLMYGCSKPGLPPYKLTYVYDYHLNKEDLTDLSTSYLIRHLSNFCTGKAVYYIKEDDLKRAELAHKIADLNSKNKKTVISSKGTKKIELSRNFILTKRRYRSKCSDSSLNEVKMLVHLLAKWRAEQYHYWIEVGWCLHNIDDGLLSSWIEFSKRSEKYREGECEKHWMNFREDGLGMGSLHRWARLDEPDKYADVVRESVTNYILKSVTCTTYDVARVVFELYKYQYKCISIKHNMWYEFRSHRWHKIDCAIGLRKKISNDVLNEYLHLVGHYTSNAIVQQDENKDQYLVKSKALTDVTYKLRDYTFKEKVLKECITFFHDEFFFSKLDCNPYLIGFDNGVYDLKKSEFRDGRPEDYISISTGNDYMEFEHDDIIIQQIYTFMAQIFPRKTTREYMWILMSSFLLGQNIEQKFHIFTGTGANGKSVLIDLFEMCFGDYCVKLPVTLLTQKRSAAGAANPELARARPARFASMQEPSDKETMNIGFMKELTGGDKIMVRALYQEPFEFKPKFKLALCCNHLPKVPPNDEACWRRLRVVEFISKFKDYPNPNNPLEFQKDEFLTDKMYTWKEAFIYLLLQYYKKYRKEGIREPDEVMKATEEYQKMCDIYIEFVVDTMEKHEENTLKLEETFQAFRVWYRENFDGKCPSRREFKEGVAKKLGKYVAGRGGGWPGWRFISHLDDADEDNTPANIFKKEVTVIKNKDSSEIIVTPMEDYPKPTTNEKLKSIKAIKPKTTNE